MAERRMFTKKVTDDDNFMSLSSSAQALYLHLMMSADDDGFSNQVSISMFKAHASMQDLQALLEKRYIYQFENGVIVIKHFRMANALRKDRYTPTAFKEELSKLSLKDNGAYTWLPDGCHVVAERLPQDSIDKDSIDKNNIYISSDEDRPKKKVVKFVPPTIEEISEYCRERKNNVNPEKFFDFYESKGWMVGKNKMKDWKAAVRTWERGDNKSASSKSTPVSNIMEYEIDNGDTHPQIPPYYGFPKEWFDGDDPVRDRFVKVKQVRNFNIGVTDDTIYSPDELWDKFILRKRGYEYEQQFGFNDCP